ncbi:hypothetical protein CPT34_25645 [Rhizobium sophoriradicis]|uniref:Uncharacterized protein n=1 Tax=Rhizobium sophoriradicis TaxID=1535245 RepID=A0A2A5KMM9_9HYPH|nr:hypothetical protein CPT34_25645 [Rhizobium sophoriradicis]
MSLYADGAFGENATTLSVIPGPEPGIHATAADGCGVDARLKAEQDGGWGGQEKPIHSADARVRDAIR